MEAAASISIWAGGEFVVVRSAAGRRRLGRRGRSPPSVPVHDRVQRLPPGLRPPSARGMGLAVLSEVTNGRPQVAALAAESLGLGTVYIGALRNDPQRVAGVLDLPQHVFAALGLVVGRPDRPRGRGSNLGCRSRRCCTRRPIGSTRSGRPWQPTKNGSAGSTRRRALATPG